MWTDGKGFFYTGDRRDGGEFPDDRGATVAEIAARTVVAESAGAAARALAAGLTITSTGTPALNGTYAVDQAQRDNLSDVAIYIAVNARFPAGQPSLLLRLADGDTIAVPSTAAWQAIATAVADYVTHLDVALDVVAQGGAWVAPAAAVTIA